MQPLPKELLDALDPLNGFKIAPSDSKAQKLFSVFEEFLAGFVGTTGATPRDVEFVIFHFWTGLLAQIRDEKLTQARTSLSAEFVAAYRKAFDLDEGTQ